VLRFAFAVVIAAGCGRINFDPNSGDSLALACKQPFDRLVLGHTSTLGQAPDGSWWGFGENYGNELTLAEGGYTVPQPLPDLDGMIDIGMDYNLGVGIAADGSLWDWGNGDRGPTPRVVDAGTDWRDPRGGWSWGCALHGAGLLACWGDNYQGNLGDGTNNDSYTPVAIPIPTVSEYGTAEYSGCAIVTGGALWCWGGNAYGQAGVGASSDQVATPMQVGTDTDWAQIATGGEFTCARKTNGTLWCWGNGYHNGMTSAAAIPTQVGTRTDWVDVRAHYTRGCGITSDRALWCWGENANGQLGTGDRDFRVPPTQVTLPGPVDTVLLGGHHTCATIGGATYCWGRNDEGMLGIGTFEDELLPVERCP
jgi:alpha-tubulin suppressor-like RCC1 family protein